MSLTKSIFGAALLSSAALQSPSFAAAPLDTTLGGIWKKQCAGPRRYGCCQQKSRQCRKDGNSVGHCNARWKICKSKRTGSLSNPMPGKAKR